MKRTKVLNVPAGGLTILASGPVRRYVVIESTVTQAGGANVEQGLNVQDLTPTNSNQAASPVLPLDIGVTFTVPPDDDNSFHQGQGNVIANGPGTLIGVGVTAALPLCLVTSSTGVATAVILTEIF